MSSQEKTTGDRGGAVRVPAGNRPSGERTERIERLEGEAGR
jgi:hypothetical protein